MLARDEKIDRALDVAYSASTQLQPFDLSTGRLVVFSDQHRGAKNGADDFFPAEKAYESALAHYFEQGHRLAVLGDAEELWEELPRDVVKAYAGSLAAEARFHQNGRYLRVWGNHDDEWLSERSVYKYLSPIFGTAPRVHGGLRLPVIDHGQALGEVFLTHGHQGTGDSDRFAGLSKFIVRNFWRPLQRLTHYSFNTPSKDFSLREHHDQSMYAWAATRSKTIIIVGHTHRPVFKSQKHATQLREDIAALERQLQEKGDDSELLLQLNELRLRLEQVLSQDGQSRDADAADADMQKPCYFNAGCCCYPDGDITGIELASGEIRLVRWSNSADKPMKVLARAALRGIFAAL
jgi:UDP-2,3-diacylglucosamine pyrophosphatase LpxH